VEEHLPLVLKDLERLGVERRVDVDDETVGVQQCKVDAAALDSVVGRSLLPGPSNCTRTTSPLLSLGGCRKNSSMTPSVVVVERYLRLEWGV
jgi:hypothetical protein